MWLCLYLIYIIFLKFGALVLSVVGNIFGTLVFAISALWFWRLDQAQPEEKAIAKKVGKQTKENS